jgi:hypothetical protein
MAMAPATMPGSSSSAQMSDGANDDLDWDDPAMVQQREAMEDDDEDLFVALDSKHGRISDGLVDLGDTQFAFRSYTLQPLGPLLANAACRQDLRRDCLLCCFPFTDKAYWLPANLRPRCTLEVLARALFDKHTARCASIDRAKSGVEWWAQFRRPGEASETIGFHFDKDEQLNTAVEGLFVQPQLACVTYLTDCGAPTVVLPIKPAPGGQAAVHRVDDVDPDTVVLSHPRAGKHMVFDGRFLHGVPASRRVPSDSEGSVTAGASEEEDLSRVTFLCNICMLRRAFSMLVRGPF